MAEIINITGPAPCTIIGPSNVKGAFAFNPLIQSFSAEYSPTTGYTFNSNFESLSYWACQQLAWQCAASGCSYKINYNQGKCTLEVTDNRGNVTIDTWEIAVNRTTRASFQNPLDIAALSSNDLKVIAYAAQNGVTVLDAVTALNAGPPAPGTPYTNPDVTTPSKYATVFDRVITLGQDSYQFDQYSFKHTTNASNRGYYNVADANVNSIYTYAHFISEITNTNYWIFPCPAELLAALSDIFAGLASAQSNFMKGALKGGSQRITAANNRINISTEYEIDVWSTDEYAIY